LKAIERGESAQAVGQSIVAFLFLAFLGFALIWILSLVEVSFLWLVLWLPAYALRRHLTFFWNPWVCTAIGLMAGVGLERLVLSHSRGALFPNCAFNPAYSAAAAGGAALFFAGYVVSKRKG
jgi:hypothetical protein